MRAINPRIGIIAEQHLKGHLLATTLREQGYDIAFNGSPGRLLEAWWEQDIDLWLVDLHDVSVWQNILDALCDKVTVPVLYSDGPAPTQGSIEHKRWVRRLLMKVSDFVGLPSPAAALAAQADPVALSPLTLPASLKPTRPDVLTHVWSLGASLGGPAAVKLFLDRLPQDTPVAFLLIQHIDAPFVESLASVLCRNSHFKCEVAQPGAKLRHGKVLIAPTEQALDFSADGEVLATNKPWRGPYAPNINQAFSTVCGKVKAEHGIIMFSGMGDDGAQAVSELANQGIPIWAQSPQTCAMSSQVDEVIKTGCVSLEAAPEYLASHLLEHLARQNNINH